MSNEGITLLIVEDNHDLRNGLKEILTHEGFTVMAAAHGRDALEQMHSATPELIISDITMPEMDGYEFFEAVRSRPEGVTIPFIFLTARGEREDVMRGKNLGAEDYLVKPLSRGELLTAVQAKLTRFRQLQLAQLEQAYQASLTALANAIEVRDEYTRGHIERVTAYAFAIADNLGWQGNKLEQLRFGAILHDIGKIFINENILRKPGPLTEAEREEILQHPTKGSEMIKDIPYLASAISIILYHHERWDGTGYPDGLAGEAIPLDARIIAVADSFDAMTTVRPYQKPYSLQEALQEITHGAGTQFDPQVVNAFRAAWEAGQIQRIVERWQNPSLEDKPHRRGA